MSTILSFATNNRTDLVVEARARGSREQDHEIIGWAVVQADDDTTQIEAVALINGHPCTESEFRNDFTDPHWTVTYR